MSDFSLFSLFAAGLACLVPFTNAYTQPVGDQPEGNPIYTPGLNDVVPVGQEYGITWQPTTEGTVTLLLLKGPADNLEVLYPIVEKIPNSGNYFWVPSTKLEPGDTGYGIQLIVDSNGQYQWSTQFGISNPDWQPSASSAAPSGYAPSSSSAAPSGYAVPTGAWSHGGYAHPTGSWGHANSTQPKPTGHYTKPKPKWHTTKAPATQTTSYAPPPTAATPPPKATGGASTVATSFFGLVAAAGIAVFAL
jgi:hypothetical protein